VCACVLLHCAMWERSEYMQEDMDFLTQCFEFLDEDEDELLTEDELKIWLSVLNHGEEPSQDDVENCIETLGARRADLSPHAMPPGTQYPHCPPPSCGRCLPLPVSAPLRLRSVLSASSLMAARHLSCHRPRHSTPVCARSSVRSFVCR
jgi:hypothetical protein